MVDGVVDVVALLGSAKGKLLLWLRSLLYAATFHSPYYSKKAEYSSKDGYSSS